MYCLHNNHLSNSNLVQNFIEINIHYKLYNYHIKVHTLNIFYDNLYIIMMNYQNNDLVSIGIYNILNNLLF